MQNSKNIQFENSYALLPKSFYAKVKPERFSNTKILSLNKRLAEELNLDSDWLLTAQGNQFLSGQEIHGGSDPLAQAYAGHQFGTFVPQLGDGRAVLLGEIVDINGNRKDFQLKGSGRTPFSRNGDGKATLGPILREYLISEYMHAINIPTTRSLAAITTGETVLREEALPGAVLVRIASSHVRIGTFQYFSARQMTDEIKLLADYIIERHYPLVLSQKEPYLRLFQNVLDRQATLISDWMSIGFIHGVMNTDNTTLSGETIDYGPCAFMDQFQYDKVFSSIDHTSRYCYQNQPRIILWNLTRLAEAMLSLIDENVEISIRKIEEVLNEFPKAYENLWLGKMSRKLGLKKIKHADKTLVEGFLDLLHKENLDFNTSFHFLEKLLEGRHGFKGRITKDHQNTLNKIEASSWYNKWKERLLTEEVDQKKIIERLSKNNPSAFPRNHLVQKVLSSAIYDGDLNPFNNLLKELMSPFMKRTFNNTMAQAPTPSEEVTQTFCGT